MQSPHHRYVHAVKNSSWLFSSVVTCAVWCLFPPDATARTPGILNYQGRIQSGGADFSGTGPFKFALMQGTTVRWRNSADADSNGEPDNAVSLAVTGGLFQIGLGDTALPNMLALSTLSVPLDTTSSTPFSLRIWFNDGTKGFQLLSPDQPLQSVAFAQVAATVDDSAISSAKLGAAAVTNSKLADSAITNIKLADSAVTSAKLATGAVTSAKLANGAVSGLDAPDGSPANAVDVNDQGFVTVGSANGTAGLSTLPGTMLINAKASTLQSLDAEGEPISTGEVTGSLTAALDGVTDLALSGSTALVVADTDNTFSVINNADPVAPVLLGMLTDGLGGVTTLGNPVGVAAGGNFAYVVSASEDAFTIINITNPTAPAVSSTRTDGVGGFNDLNNPLDVAVSGNFAYVASQDDDAVTIINVTSKTAPTLAAVIKNGVGGITTLDSPRYVAVAGTRLYVSSGGGLSVFNITNPAVPVLLGSINDFFDGVLAVAGTTLYAGGELRSDGHRRLWQHARATDRGAA